MFLADNIVKSYHGRPVLKGVRLCLGPGQCLGIVGDNGSGKSTLLKILAQIIPADSGDIRYRNKSVLGDRKFLRKHLGYVPQGSDLLPELTARQSLQLWQSACGCVDPVPEDVSRILGLEELMDVKIGHMSGGMRRRVSIAMALSTSPEILIMDEVTNGLDAAYREALLDYLENWLSRGGRMIWCSHLPEELDRLCGARLNLSE